MNSYHIWFVLWNPLNEFSLGWSIRRCKLGSDWSYRILGKSFSLDSTHRFHSRFYFFFWNQIKHLICIFNHFLWLQRSKIMSIFSIKIMIPSMRFFLLLFLWYWNFKLLLFKTPINILFESIHSFFLIEFEFIVNLQTMFFNMLFSNKQSVWTFELFRLRTFTLVYSHPILINCNICFLDRIIKMNTTIGWVEFIHEILRRIDEFKSFWSKIFTHDISSKSFENFMRIIWKRIKNCSKHKQRLFCNVIEHCSVNNFEKFKIWFFFEILIWFLWFMFFKFYIIIFRIFEDLFIKNGFLILFD